MNAPLFGLLNVNKPAGMSSRAVVDRVVRAVRPAKAGHAGTLDPMATGVLVVCVGRATRLIEYVQRQRKRYAAGFLLGRRSDTDDTTGQLSEVPVDKKPSREEIACSLQEFVGRIEQVPPQFSAVHVDGKRAYRLARQGQRVEIQPRPVQVYHIGLTRYDYPELDLVIECGSGTYIRSIGRDLGEQLGCGAVMSRLSRTAIGDFTLESAIALDDLNSDSVSDLLLPAQRAVADLPTFPCTTDDLMQLQHGRPISATSQGCWPAGTAQIAVIAPDGSLVAIVTPADDGRTLSPTQVFNIAK